jgi:hypothetical protein
MCSYAYMLFCYKHSHAHRFGKRKMGRERDTHTTDIQAEKILTSHLNLHKKKTRAHRFGKRKMGWERDTHQQTYKQQN